MYTFFLSTFIDFNILFKSDDDGEGKQAFWHSSAHILAQTIKDIYPKSKLTIGPAIDNGFYYDVDFGGNNPSENDFKKIEEKFLEFAREDNEFKMRHSSKSDALSYYKKEKNEYKVELIEELEDGTITFCDHSDFSDLCKGGHIPSTGIVKSVKLLNIAGAYWRGDEKNNQLTRIYGISFPKQKMLTEYLELVEKAKERDHRKLGKELELFTFSSRVGNGLPLWLPNGTELRDRLQRFLEDAQRKAGYKKVMTSIPEEDWIRHSSDSVRLTRRGMSMSPNSMGSPSVPAGSSTLPKTRVRWCSVVPSMPRVQNI